MRPDATIAHPRRPHSEVEWEDLLLRVEVMPRALGVVLDDLDAADDSIDEVLRQLSEREAFVGHFLERAAARGAADDDERYLSAASEVATDSARAAMDRFVRLRMRNFAMVQRRGIDVWDWEAVMTGSVRATVHQVLSQLVAEDVAAIALLRGAPHIQGGEC